MSLIVTRVRACLVKVQDRIHHQELFFHRNAGVIRVECILLQESKTNDTCNLKRPVSDHPEVRRFRSALQSQ